MTLELKYSNRCITIEVYIQTHSVSKYDLRANYVTGHLPSAGGPGVNEIDMDPVFTELASSCFLPT